MKKTYLLLLLIMLSCKSNKDIETVSFDTIDVSFSDGWDYPYTAWINENGNIVVFYDKETFFGYDEDEEIYYERYQNHHKFAFATLPSNVMDTLSSLVKNINFEMLDTLYKRGCQDCGSYKIIIKKDSITSKLLVNGVSYDDKRLEMVNKLVDYIYFLSLSILKDSSNIIFETKRGFYNIPPPPRK